MTEIRYTIRVEYQTGDSFGSEDTSCTVGVFNSLEEAQKACEDIIDHYNYAKEGNYSDQYLKKVSKMPWYNTIPGATSGTWRFTLQTQGQVIGAAWTGYFEILHSLHIELMEPEENLSYCVH